MKRTSNLLIATVLALFFVPALAAATVNCSGVAPWSGNSVTFSAGTLVTFQGNEYKCTQSHTSLPGWDPVSVPALWSLVGACSSGVPPTPTPTPKPSATPTATPKPTVTPKPTASATPRPTATPKPTATPTPGLGCKPVWDPATAYPGGSQASFNGVNYQAAFWTRGDEPDLNNGPSGSGKPWISQGPCGGPTPTPTAIGPT